MPAQMAACLTFQPESVVGFESDIIGSPGSHGVLGWIDERAHNGMRAIRVVVNIMAGKNTGICHFDIRNGRRTVRGNNVRVEIYQSLTTDVGRDRSHPMRRMARGTGKTPLRNVEPVPGFHARDTETAG